MWCGGMVCGGVVRCGDIVVKNKESMNTNKNKRTNASRNKH